MNGGFVSFSVGERDFPVIHKTTDVLKKEQFGLEPHEELQGLQSALLQNNGVTGVNRRELETSAVFIEATPLANSDDHILYKLSYKELLEAASGNSISGRTTNVEGAFTEEDVRAIITGYEKAAESSDVARPYELPAASQKAALDEGAPGAHA